MTATLVGQLGVGLLIVGTAVFFGWRMWRCR